MLLGVEMCSCICQVLGTRGKAGSGLNPLQFDQPAEIFVHDSGEIYIVDGDGGMNNRLIKLSKEQEVVWMHGEKGQGMAQFYIPPQRDRGQRPEGVGWPTGGNKRIQVFNSITGRLAGDVGELLHRGRALLRPPDPGQEVLCRRPAQHQPDFSAGCPPRWD